MPLSVTQSCEGENGHKSGLVLVATVLPHLSERHPNRICNSVSSLLLPIVELQFGKQLFVSIV